MITTFYEQDQEKVEESESEDPFTAIQHHHVESKNSVDRYRIPCDWKLAEKHALAHITAPDRKLKDEEASNDIIK